MRPPRVNWSSSILSSASAVYITKFSQSEVGLWALEVLYNLHALIIFWGITYGELRTLEGLTELQTESYHYQMWELHLWGQLNSCNPALLQPCQEPIASRIQELAQEFLHFKVYSPHVQLFQMLLHKSCLHGPTHWGVFWMTLVPRLNWGWRDPSKTKIQVTGYWIKWQSL